MDRLDFVTLEGLLAYGEVLAHRTAGEGMVLPPAPSPSADRPRRAREAMEKIRAFVQRAQKGFPRAEEYRVARRGLIDDGCGGDELVFFAAWNQLLAAGELAPLVRAPIGSVQKPPHRRPVGIVPRAQLTPQLAEDRIVLDLGDDRFWLLPRDLTGRTLLFTMRHGVSRVESAKYRVGRRLANVLDPDRGVAKADAVGGALARMIGVVGQQLDFLHLYSYPGGHSFFDVYVDVVDGFRRLGQWHQGKVLCLYTHSSTLRALMIYLDPRPFREAFTEFGEYKEGQDNVVLLTFEHGLLSGYSTAVGLSARERAARDAWMAVERERRDRVTLKPKQIKRIVALVSGGDFAGAGAALKELRVAGNRLGLEVLFVRHGFLGLANNWIEAVTEQATRGMGSNASTPIGSSRFEDFKDEHVQQATMRHLKPHMEDGALVVIGGDGSLRGARALYEGFGVQVVGIPGTIDNNIAGTTALGFHSAVALANQSIESLKATSAAMGSVFFVEIMGAGSGHLALACAYQARAEGVLVNEHPDPDAYIDEVILGTLKRSLGVPNKSHLFVVAERTPHRHHRGGGIHGLVEYVASAIGQWPQLQARSGYHRMTLATKATILGHTLRGALPTPEDKAIAQHLGYETVRRLVGQPESVVGCMLAYREAAVIAAIPLHAVAPKKFDWELFARMHGTELP